MKSQTTNHRWGGRAARVAARVAGGLGLCLLVLGCSDDGNDEGAENGFNPFGGDAGAAVPLPLVGSWYAGSGGTTAPYDPNTGSWGHPNGKGLIYVFASNGTYQKAFQSYESSGACTTGFTAFESGTLHVYGPSLSTNPTSGHMVYEATCSPELNSDTPTTALAQESFTWSLEPAEYDPSIIVLRLRRDDGAESVFTPL